MADKYSLRELEEMLQVAQNHYRMAVKHQDAVRTQIGTLTWRSDFKFPDKINSLEYQDTEWETLIEEYGKMIGKLQRAIIEKEVDVVLEPVDKAYEELSNELYDKFGDFQG